MESKKRILYLDDEYLNLKLFEMTFSKDYEVMTALDGCEGLEVLERFDDIEKVVSDMRMPKLNGYDFTVRAKAEYPDIVFAILSGYEITAEINTAIEQGIITRYFTKPFNKKEIDDFLAG